MKLFRRISDRLDALESAPPPEYDLDRLRGIMAGVSGQTNTRLDAAELGILQFTRAMEETEQRVKDLTFAVAEGIERVDRSERRIHATVKRARKELAEHGFESPRLEAEAAELRSVDGKGGVESEVPSLPAGVGPTSETPSSIKGVPAETLARVRGI